MELCGICGVHLESMGECKVHPVSTTLSELNIVHLFSIGASKEEEEGRITKPLYTKSNFTNLRVILYGYGPTLMMAQ